METTPSLLENFYTRKHIIFPCTAFYVDFLWFLGLLPVVSPAHFNLQFYIHPKVASIEYGFDTFQGNASKKPSDSGSSKRLRVWTWTTKPRLFSIYCFEDPHPDAFTVAF
jgi:hypothetical protein